MKNEVVNELKQLAFEAICKIDTPAFYKVDYQDEEVDEVYSFLLSFNDEQLVEVRKILSECNANGISLDEYFEECPVPQYLSTNRSGLFPAPVSICLEKSYHRCRVKIALYRDNIEKASEVINTDIMLWEEDFVSLLEWQLLNRESSYNDLYNTRPELFKTINNAVRSCFSNDFVLPNAMPAFAVELTAIKQMAFDICGEPAISEEIYAPNGEISEHSYLHIENRVLSFFYEKIVETENNCVLEESVYIDDVDAIAVQDALGMSNYKGILCAIRESFGNRDGVLCFEEFLKENQIDFTIRKSCS